ncbi:hypothetical protein MPSEU_000342500 [Mayamaea pseudoterrestris]|nr:hypothetical protein MPSEU_000342500 [Mayamaea pseudoterrestris]
MAEEGAAQEGQVVTLDWNELCDTTAAVNDKVVAALEEAYGSTGTGILAVRNVPGFVKAKHDLFSLAHKFVFLPSDYLETKLTDKESLYNSGWSFGKEKLGDTPDTSKGSFYFNPITDTPGTLDDRQQYPLSYPKNIWPTEKLPELEPAAKELGCLLTRVAVHVGRLIDIYVKKHNDEYAEAFLHDSIKNTDKVKGRLLYYFPLDNDVDDDSCSQVKKEDSWIGWHNDSGYLTALAGDLYVNHETGQILEQSPDPSSGLYVVNRSDCVLHVRIPDDCCAIQIGECTQICTGGAVTATPHCVRGCSDSTVARVSLACFVDVKPSTKLSMPSNCTRDKVLNASMPSARVPPLGKRWIDEGMTFGDFLKATFEMYYKWTTQAAE